jgi:hypothetical protein
MGATWSGLDRPPKWHTALDAVGQTREQLWVKEESEEPVPLSSISSPGNPVQALRLEEPVGRFLHQDPRRSGWFALGHPYQT